MRRTILFLTTARILPWCAGRLAVVALTALVGGCGIVDKFGDRAVDYNRETAGSKGGSILINVMRAAYGAPLQFTDVTTVAGQGSVGGGIGSNIPLTAFPPTTPQLSSISPSGSASANSTFNVANLNTQEFYNGLQTPITTQLIGSYLASGFDPSVLLQLVVSDIELETSGSRTIIHNSARDNASFQTFNTAIRLLVRAGINVERSPDTQGVGPVLTLAQASDPKLLSTVIATTAADAPEIKAVSDGRYQLQRKSVGYRFCFDRLRSEKASTPYGDKSPSLQKINSSEAMRGFRVPLVIAGGEPGPALSFTVDSSRLCGSKVSAKTRSPELSGGTRVGLNFSFRPRSPESIILYLGEMARTQLGLSGKAPSDLAIYRKNYYDKFYLFRVNTGYPATDSINFDYGGVPYNIALDPSGEHDSSSRVIQFITELLALQSSAKNLPAPSVISIIGR